MGNGIRAVAASTASQSQWQRVPGQGRSAIPKAAMITAMVVGVGVMTIDSDVGGSMFWGRGRAACA